MKYVVYNLKWVGSNGEQPYEKAAEVGGNLSGGIIVNDREYFGYMFGESQAAINNCSNFNMRELTQEEALQFWNTVIPEGSEVFTPNGDLKHATASYLKEDGTITYDLI